MPLLPDRADVVRRRHVAAAFTAGLLAIGVVLICWRDLLVPEKMTFDSQLIQRIAQGKVLLGKEDKSYGNIGELYQFLGLGYQPELASAIGFGIYFVLLAGVNARLADHRVNLLDRLVLVAAAGLGGIFLGQYSKDVLVALLVMIAFFAGKGWPSEIFFVLAAVAYASYFRQYWYLVVVLYVVLRLIHGRWHRLWPLLVACVLFLVVLALVLPVVGHVDIQSFRLNANADRVGSEDAQSMIMPMIPGGSVPVGAVNTVISFGQLLLPLPMIAMGAQHAVYGAFLITIWGLFLDGIRRARRAAALPVFWSRGCALALAMVSVQAIFEPDYGSYLRHLTPLLPLMVYVAVVPRGLRVRGSDDIGERQVQ